MFPFLSRKGRRKGGGGRHLCRNFLILRGLEGAAGSEGKKGEDTCVNVPHRYGRGARKKGKGAGENIRAHRGEVKEGGGSETIKLLSCCNGGRGKGKRGEASLCSGPGKKEDEKRRRRGKYVDPFFFRKIKKKRHFSSAAKWAERKFGVSFSSFSMI